MKQIIKLTIILSLFAQVCSAQKVVTEEEYKVLNDSIISLLKIAEKDANKCVGKPFLKLVKHFEKCGLKITSASYGRYDNQMLYPQNVYGISVAFISNETDSLRWKYNLLTPKVFIDFEGSKPYGKALSLFREYKGNFTEEVEAFYSDAVVKSIKFGFMDGEIYLHPKTNPKVWKWLPMSKDKVKPSQE